MKTMLSMSSTRKLVSVLNQFEKLTLSSSIPTRTFTQTANLPAFIFAQKRDFSKAASHSINHLDIKIPVHDINKAKLLAALFNKTSPAEPLSVMQAEIILEDSERLYGRCEFESLEGKALKVTIGELEMDAREYNAMYGQNAAQDIIKEIREANKKLKGARATI